MIEIKNAENFNAVKKKSARRKRKGFIERSLLGFVRNIESALYAEEQARGEGLLQQIDPRVKIIGFFALILSVTLSRNLLTIFLIFLLAVGMALLSRVSLKMLWSRAWVGAFFFTGTIALPIIFLAPGETLARIPLINIGISAQGVKSAAFLLARAETAVTLSLLLVLCTLWTHVLKALRVLGVPVVLTVILGMTHRYIFVMLDTARNMFEARQSRFVGKLSAADNRRLAAAGVGVLLTKSVYLNNEVFLAMQSRGFRGEIYTLDEFAMTSKDWLALFLFLTAAGILFWLGQFDALFQIGSLSL